MPNMPKVVVPAPKTVRLLPVGTEISPCTEKIEPFGRLEYKTRFHANDVSPTPPYHVCAWSLNRIGTSTSSWFFMPKRCSWMM